MDDHSYDQLAEAELGALIDALDGLGERGCEAELESGILTLEFDDGVRYVVNSHRAARQIWMAAERSAWHFDWHAEKGQWFASKTADELWATLSRALGKKLGHPVELSRNPH